MKILIFLPDGIAVAPVKEFARKIGAQIENPRFVTQADAGVDYVIGHVPEAYADFPVMEDFGGLSLPDELKQSDEPKQPEEPGQTDEPKQPEEPKQPKRATKK